MHPLIERIDQCVSSRRLLGAGDRVVVAVSGGLDSMALLHVLHTLAPRHGWRIAVAHFNHRLRGKAADADQRLVRAAAAKLQLPFKTGHGDVRSFSLRHKVSIEMAARKLRHEFLGRAARAFRASRIAVAHHADDQVELFLIRLLRGAGAEGLGGMDWTAPSPADARATLVRPLLGVSKAELSALAADACIPFREDASNASPKMLRNRVRHQLLPLLRKDYQPGVDAVLHREADLLREDADFILAEAIQWLGSTAADFETLPVALQRRVLQVSLLQAAIPPDFSLIEALRGEDAPWISVSPSLACRRTASGRIESRAIVPAAAFSDAELVVILAPGKTRTNVVEFSGLRLEWSFLEGHKLPRRKSNREYFDAGAMGGAVVLRHWRPGDRFQPIGMKEAVKLQDLFVNAKIPPSLRRRLAVATTDSGEIFWVEGLRMAERFKVTPLTKQRLGWRWKRTI